MFTLRKVALSSCLFSMLAVSQCSPTQISFGQCPVRKTYSSQFQKQAAVEYKVAGPKVKTLVTDYKSLRDACTELEKTKT